MKKDITRVPRFSLRKTTLGMVSAIIAFGIFAGAQTVHADEVEHNAEPQTEQVVSAKDKDTNDKIKVDDKQDNKAAATKTTENQAKSADVIKSDISIDSNTKGIDKDDPTIIDLSQNKDGKYSTNVSVKNDKEQDTNIQSIISLPLFNSKDSNQNVEGKAKTYLDGPVETTGYEDGALVQYWFDSLHAYRNADNLGDLKYQDVSAVAVTGKVKAGQQANVKLNLKLENEQEVKEVLNKVINGQATYEQNNSQLRLIPITVSNYDADDKNNKLKPVFFYGYYEIPDETVVSQLNDLYAGKTKWTPNFMIKDGTDPNGRQYVMAPKEVQELISKNIKSSDISFYDVNNKKTDTIYTDGQYHLDLEKPFNDINKLGYTVNILPDGTNIWPYYSYATNYSHENWHFAVNGKGDAESNKDDLATWDSPIYLEIQRVFKTHDSKLTTNDEWSPADNLDSANVYFSNKGTMNYASHHDLKTDPVYHYSYILVDAQGNKVYDSQDLANNDHHKLAAGKYVITYFYTINGEHNVYKSATITVTDMNKPKPKPVQPTNKPTNPTSPVEPKNPTSPAPVTPETPAQPTNAPVLPEDTPTEKDNNNNDNNENVAPKAQKVSDKKVTNNKRVNAPVLAQTVNKEIKHEAELPQTGEKNSFLAVLTGLASVAVGFFFSKKREH